MPSRPSWVRYSLYGIVTALVLLGLYYLVPTLPSGSADPISGVTAEHLSQTHGLRIVEGPVDASSSADIVLFTHDHTVQVELTAKGLKRFDASDQQALGLNGTRKIEMSKAEYQMFLDNLHGLLLLKSGTGGPRK